jgi:hypothetical protein
MKNLITILSAVIFLASCNSNSPFVSEYKIEQEIYYYGLNCEGANINTWAWKGNMIMGSTYDKDVVNVDSVAKLRLRQANKLITCDSLISL